MSRRQTTILDAVRDPKLFASHFRGSTWEPWFAFLASLFALPLTPEQLEIYARHTGRSSPPSAPHTEAWLTIGRRGGKSFILALIAVFLACFRNWRPYLGPGEVGTIMIIAADRRQTRVIMRYVLGLLKSVPMLRQLIVNETRESITLRNRVVIEVHTASFRTTRGYSIIAALLDEVAYWQTGEDSAEPDVEVINAVIPGMATIPGAMLLCASSPYARKGAMWEAYSRHFAQDGDPVLVWQAGTRDMNATVSQRFVDKHLEQDPTRAAAEYLAQFRSDVEGFIPREVVAACVGDYVELLPARGLNYWGIVDPAGGMGSDSFAATVLHKEGEQVVIDALREFRPPFNPASVIDQLIPWFRSYRVFKIHGDRWAGGFPPEAFARGGLTYAVLPFDASTGYVTALPRLNARLVTIPRNDRLFGQIVALERHVAVGGHDRISHPAGARSHDDLANVVLAGVALVTTTIDPGEIWGKLGRLPPEQTLLRNSSAFSALDYVARRANGERVTPTPIQTNPPNLRMRSMCPRADNNIEIVVPDGSGRTVLFPPETRGIPRPEGGFTVMMPDRSGTLIFDLHGNVVDMEISK